MLTCFIFFILPSICFAFFNEKIWIVTQEGYIYQLFQCNNSVELIARLPAPIYMYNQTLPMPIQNNEQPVYYQITNYFVLNQKNKQLESMQIYLCNNQLQSDTLIIKVDRNVLQMLGLNIQQAWVSFLNKNDLIRNQLNVVECHLIYQFKINKQRQLQIYNKITQEICLVDTEGQIAYIYYLHQQKIKRAPVTYQQMNFSVQKYRQRFLKHKEKSQIKFLDYKQEIIPSFEIHNYILVLLFVGLYLLCNFTIGKKKEKIQQNIKYQKGKWFYLGVQMRTKTIKESSDKIQKFRLLSQQNQYLYTPVVKKNLLLYPFCQSMPLQKTHIFNVIKTIKYLHQNGFIHGNICYQNIIFLDGVPKLLYDSQEKGVTISDDIAMIKSMLEILTNQKMGMKNLFQHLLLKLHQNYDPITNVPYFWPREHKLIFLQQFSNFLNTIIVQKRYLSVEFEKFCKKNMLFDGQWFIYLDIEMIQQIKKSRNYRWDSAKDLIRLIRNKINHFYQLPQNIKQKIGNTPLQICQYFLQIFPSLLPILYQFALINNFRLSI